MSFDALQALRDAGTPVDQLSSEQQSVISTFAESEVATLISVQSRLAEVAGEVEGQTVVGVGIF